MKIKFKIKSISLPTSIPYEPPSMTLTVVEDQLGTHQAIKQAQDSREVVQVEFNYNPEVRKMTVEQLKDFVEDHLGQIVEITK